MSWVARSSNPQQKPMKCHKPFEPHDFSNYLVNLAVPAWGHDRVGIFEIILVFSIYLIWYYSRIDIFDLILYESGSDSPIPTLAFDPSLTEPNFSAASFQVWFISSLIGLKHIFVVFLVFPTDIYLLHSNRFHEAQHSIVNSDSRVTLGFAFDWNLLCWSNGSCQDIFFFQLKWGSRSRAFSPSTTPIYVHSHPLSLCFKIAMMLLLNKKAHFSDIEEKENIYI